MEREPIRKMAFSFLLSFLLTSIIVVSCQAKNASPLAPSPSPVAAPSNSQPTETNPPVPSQTSSATATSPTILATPTYLPVIASQFTPNHEYYAAPNGSPSGQGTLQQPWDLVSALENRKGIILPGDILWLRGGKYGSGGGTIFNSKLQGTEKRPVVVRQYPGERATVDGGIMAYGKWTWFWGFEITDSSPVRTTDGNHRPFGLNMLGQGHKAINLIIDNVGHPGIGFWEEVGDGGEIYGCLIWGVGLYDTTYPGNTARGSAIYAQNQYGVRFIEDVISFRNFTTGMKAYSEQAYVNGFRFIGNVSFDNPDRNIFVSGGDHPALNTQLLNNFTFRRSNDQRESIDLGYPQGDQGDAIVKDNYFVSGSNDSGALLSKHFKSLVVTGNTFISPKTYFNWLKASSGNVSQWDNNRYFGAGGAAFKINYNPFDFNSWKANTGFDSNSIYDPSYPTGTSIFVRKNKYDPDRAHIIIYNWDRNRTVSADVSGVLKAGEPYILLDAQNYFGEPVASGVYDGNPIEVPMDLTQVSPIIGDFNHFENVHTPIEFGVYILIGNPR